jgi:hypothetical protein
LGQSGGDKETQERLEIFAVAAVGFTLKHDAQFKTNFLKKFAGIDEDDENYEPKLQPADCIDLELKHSQKHILVVIEFKVWAELQPKQNPWLDGRKYDDAGLPFWLKAENGYGYQLGQKNYDQFSTIYYIVVQQNERRRDEKPCTKFGKTFWLKSRSWKALLDPTAEMEEDLVNSLGEIGIEELKDWRMKTMKIKPETVAACANGAEVIKVLLWVSEKLGLTIKSWAGFGPECFGIGLDNKVAARLSEKRSAFLGQHRWGVGWFGYLEIPEQSGKFQPEVWFYCNNGAKPKLLETLKNEFQDSSVELPEPPESDDPPNCIRIRRSQDSLAPDGSWFCKALGIKGDK